MTNTPERSLKLQEAIRFLVYTLGDLSGKSKPEIIHSIKVGLLLDEYGYDEHLVIAGFLHDLLEESSVSYKEIKDQFGEKVAQLVQSVSYDKKVKDKWGRYMQTYERSSAYGRDALIIKAADILDNINYFKFVDDKDIKKVLLKKYEHFLDNTENIIGPEAVWQKLKEKYTALVK